MRVGVLALQGDFDAHARAVSGAGGEPVLVRAAAALHGLAALILPGGESTTISKGMQRLALYEPLRAFAAAGRPVLGSCAGAILMAREVEHHAVPSLGLLDLVAVRNAYGTQGDSFFAPADAGTAPGLDGLSCLFIRAPRLRALGPDVEVLARVDGAPVLVRQGRCFATTFHPELTGDVRVHAMLLAAARDADADAA